MFVNIYYKYNLSYFLESKMAAKSKMAAILSIMVCH